MPTLDFIVQPRLTPRRSLAEDSHFLHVVGRPSRTRLGVLRVYDVAGDLVSAGRYHFMPAPVSTPRGIQLLRRHTGGRVVPFGDGFVGVSLTLPHRAALVADDPMMLAPYQVMNRYVRGILEACRLVNLPVFYPGRDFVTVNRRLLALVSFEVDRSGALLFEAIIANQRDFSVLPEFLDAVDPEGVMPSDVLTPSSTTCLAEQLGVRLSLQEVAELVQRGFEKQFGLTFEAHELTPLEHQAIAATASHEFHDDCWIQQRRVRPELDHRAVTRVQLGQFHVHFALEQEHFIKDIVFGGDFIANSPAIERLEHELRLCPVEWRAIDALASELFAQPENFILGIGHVRTIADTITTALAP